MFSFHVVYKTVPTGSNFLLAAPISVWPHSSQPIRYNTNVNPVNKGNMSFPNICTTLQDARYHNTDDHNPNMWSVHMHVSYSYVYLFVLGSIKFFWEANVSSVSGGEGWCVSQGICRSAIETMHTRASDVAVSSFNEDRWSSECHLHSTRILLQRTRGLLPDSMTCLQEQPKLCMKLCFINGVLMAHIVQRRMIALLVNHGNGVRGSDRVVI
jgi:hypothetical protein